MKLYNDNINKPEEEILVLTYLDFTYSDKTKGNLVMMKYKIGACLTLSLKLTLLLANIPFWDLLRI